MYKQIIIIRKDLGMSTGKIAVQACHACLGAFKKSNKSSIDKWMSEGQKKVVLEVDSREEINKLYNSAKKEKIPCFLVKDAGLTELEPGTITALGIGPTEENKINKVTGSLRLL